MAKKRNGRKPGESTPPAGPVLIEAPSPPDDLGEYGKEYWLSLAPQLIELNILTPVHLQSFRVLCEQWQQYRSLTVWLDEDPARMMFTTDKGYSQETPQVRQRDKALAALQKLWLKFGLTPHSLAQLNKRGGIGRQQMPKIAQFAKAKYDE
jgi:P27 family predicted phage terminase small subunit